MAFTEKCPNTPALHNKNIHNKVLSTLTKYPPGFILDIPSGPGYLLRELKKIGFSGIAGEIDGSLHLFDDIKYCGIDMSNKFPFADSTFDYIVSIEGIEHIENHFSFLREVSRTLKPNGSFIMTTPNIHSMESKFNFFLSGFHTLANKPIPVNSENIYFEHINPISLESIYFICTKEGLSIERLETSKYRKGSLLFYYMLYPILYISTYLACFMREKEPSRKLMNRRIFDLLISKENLAGGHTIIIAKKDVPHSTR